MSRVLSPTELWAQIVGKIFTKVSSTADYHPPPRRVKAPPGRRDHIASI
jgi:hypothetical protein